MLEDYLKKSLSKMKVSEKQRVMFLQVLQDIKTNKELFADFQTMESFGSMEDNSSSSELTSSTNDDEHFDGVQETFFADLLPAETMILNHDIDSNISDSERRSETVSLVQNPTGEEDILLLKAEEEFLAGIFDELQEEYFNNNTDNDVGIHLTNTRKKPIGIANESTLEKEEATKTTLSTNGPPVSATSTVTLLGRYIDLGILGKGGMGEVRKVKDQILNRELAMKILYPVIVRSQHVLDRFIEEAQICSQLQHPNIVPIHELGTLPDGRYYFTMKEILGVEFTELIKSVHTESTEHVWRTTPDGITFRRLIQIFHTICETMACAHSKGVIHRDLKPENIMIGGFGEVLIVDWGIAKVLGLDWKEIDDIEHSTVQTKRSEGNVKATRMGMISGTPSYMSPEQAFGHVELISARSDVYSLGAILYQILSGVPPYMGKSALEIVKKVRTTKPNSLLTTSESNTVFEPEELQTLEYTEEGKIPLPLIKICEKSMERVIEDRYISAEEFAQEISNWLEGAQKRERALTEFETATGILRSAIEQEASYIINWSQANRRIQQHDFEEENSWTEWDLGNKAKTESEQLHRDYRRILHGALVYDSELEEANEALANLLLEDIIIAQANGERTLRAILEQQFKSHLQYLSKRLQGELRFEMEKRRQNDIILLRAQKGALIGRTQLRIDIASKLKDHSRLVSLIGTAGVGKTRLALEVIYDLQESDTDTYFCDLTEASSELGVALSVAKSMNIKLRNVDPIGHLGELFSKKSTILVLDNLEQVIENVGKVITRWMNQSESLRIIATSRIKLRLPQEHSFPIRPLSLLEGMELFAKRGQQADGQFTLNKDTRCTVGHLVQQLDALPLAIELAAARLNIFSIEEVADRLNERFSLLRSRTKGVQALQGALDWSWDLLKPWAKLALSQSSVFRSGFDVSAAEQILDCGDWKEAPPIFDILQDLSENSLLQQRKNSDGYLRYGLLESIRQYSRDKLNNDDSLVEGLCGAIINRETEIRHADYYSRFGQPQFLDSLDNQGSIHKWGIFFDDLDNFVAGTGYGTEKTASLCCFAAMKILGMKGPISLGVQVVEKTLKKTEPSSRQRKKMEVLRTRFLRISGRMNEARGDQRERGRRKSTKGEKEIIASKVEVEAAQSTDDEIVSTSESGSAKTNETEEVNVERYSEDEKQDLRVEADELLEKGNLEEAESVYDQALEYYQQASTIYQRIGEVKGLVEVQQKMADVFRNQGKPNNALKYLENALEIADNNGFKSMKAHLYATLGDTHRSKSNYKEALASFQNGLEINSVLNDRFLEASIFGSMGDVYLQLGESEESLKYFQLALTINREIGNKRGEGDNLGRIGLGHQILGQYNESIKHHKKSLIITREIGNKRGEGTNLGNLGLVYRILGQHEVAIDYHKEALHIAQEIGNKSSEAVNLGNVGLLYKYVGQYEQSLDYHQKALKIFEEIGDKRRMGMWLGNLGIVYENMGQYEKTIKLYKESIEISTEIGDERGKGISLGNLGELFMRLDRLDEAKTHLLQAIKQCEDSMPNAAGAFQGSLALLLVMQDNIHEAEIALKIGEPLVATYPSEHGKFLCKKATLYHLAKQPKEAEEALEHAKSIASELNPAENSEFGKAITQATALLSDKPLHPKPLPSKNTEIEALSDDEKEDLRVEADELLEKGNIEEAESVYDEALNYYQRAATVYKRIGELKGVVEVLQKMADVFRKRGVYKDALEILERALQIAEDNSFNSMKAHLYLALGTVYRFQSNYKKALEIYEKALKINTVFKDRFLEANILGSLGNVYKYSGQHEEALESYEEALLISREIGDRRGEGSRLGNLGNVYQRMGQNEEAIKYLQQALLISREIGDRRVEGINLGNLGDIFLRLNRLDEAKTHLLQAIEHCDENLPVAAGVFRGSLAFVYAKQGNIEEAEVALELGEPLVAVYPSEHGKFLCTKAKSYHLAKQPKEAENALEEAENIASEINATEDSELGKAIAETKAFISKKHSIPFTK